MHIATRDRLIVALDVPTTDEAQTVVDRLGDAVTFYKIGMQLQFAGGLEFARQLIDSGKKVFLDSKLFDIDATVAHAVKNIAKMGVHFLTIHGNKTTIKAAADARAGSDLKLLSVTVLTSLDAADMQDLGFGSITIEDLALHRAKMAIEAGADGVITSGEEAAAIRALARDKLTIVTPGIRPDGSAQNDQKRVVTPYEAVRRGADYLVMGRPILRADDPQAQAQKAIDDIERALAER